MRLYLYVVPGLVIQAVLVGGGYATGRELVEFFVSKGPATGLAGLALTALWISGAAVVSFELARRYSAFDYRSFCRIFLGRFWILFEIGYYALSVVCATNQCATVARRISVRCQCETAERTKTFREMPCRRSAPQGRTEHSSLGVPGSSLCS